MLLIQINGESFVVLRLKNVKVSITSARVKKPFCLHKSLKLDLSRQRESEITLRRLTCGRFYVMFAVSNINS